MLPNESLFQAHILSTIIRNIYHYLSYDKAIIFFIKKIWQKGRLADKRKYQLYQNF